ncbi:transcriptional regulator, TetR family [Caminicella sporogenes DSM 14501]|uniref:Transcriptional regulator, TetR family n=1 Tax=Caminicella sporogenes DSM 14501 TaxID=1121266 RepID=A0A1M6KZH8_9FIRM|nr:TetR/AcrR family transcriptional regulator [Caminicella sporogenes]RKD27656.1 hypothetical protein BET04_00895 [Caminicella sporogenes]WIF94769.1 TetR/AcrR family transcriptional regulator [Caminicella sporogenes]SHJ64393.1 transcriptional regulator, TetR family [Caminicella sporogenes DSM 14501]
MKKKISKSTEERILDAAIKIFSKKGYSAATTSEIAREAKVAEGTIFRYFPKKKELLHGILLKAIDIFGKEIIIKPLEEIIEENKDKSLEEILKVIIINRVKIFEEYFDYIKVILCEIQFHDDIRQLFIDKILKKIIETVERLVDIAKDRGEIKDIESMIIIRSVIGMVFMMLIQRQFVPLETSISNIEEEIDLIIDIFMNGIKKKD